MSAGCYLCELNFGVIPDQSQGEAVGSCKLCGVLACLAHGYRNADRPAYICGVCLPNLLTVAAVRKLPKGDDPPTRASSDDAPEPEPTGDSGFAAWAGEIDEVEDVIGDFAGDRWLSIRNDVSYLVGFLARSEATILPAFSEANAIQSRTLMATAVAIATHERLPEHEMIPMLRRATVAVHRYA